MPDKNDGGPMFPQTRDDLVTLFEGEEPKLRTAVYPGVSVRAYAAIHFGVAIMQGGSPDDYANGNITELPRELAHLDARAGRVSVEAVALADALLAELDKKNGPDEQDEDR